MEINPAGARSNRAMAALDFYLDDLSVDVFEVQGNGLTVDSLTGGHGMGPDGASSCGGYSTPISCICSCQQQ